MILTGNEWTLGPGKEGAMAARPKGDFSLPPVCCTAFQHVSHAAYRRLLRVCGPVSP